MSTRGRRRRLRAYGCVVAAALAIAACGNSSTASGKSGSSTTERTAQGASAKVPLTGVPGVTDTEIRFSSFGTDSNNPLGTCVLKCFDEGIKAYFAYRNSQGGLDGRKLVLSKELDDQLAKNQEKALEIVSANDTFASFSATEVASGWAEMAKAGIPLYVWNIFSPEATAPSIYGAAPGGVFCVDCTNRAFPYVAKLAGAKRIAVLGYGSTESSKKGAQAAAQSITMYSSDIGGAQVVYTNDALPFGLPNGVSPEVTAMKKANVDLVIGALDLNGMKTFAQEMQRQGVGDVPMYHENSYDQDFVKSAGQLFEGDYVLAQFRPFEADSGGSALDTFKTWMAKQGSKPVELAMHGWIAADIAYEGLKAAGPQFDRAKVIQASNTQLTKFTADGLVPPVDFSRQHQPPTQADPATHGPALECVALVKVHNGNFELVSTDKTKPWFCWPGNTRAWSEPTLMNFG